MAPLRWTLCSTLLWLAGCAGWPAPDIDAELARLLPADVLLLGEQHDAPQHQRLQRQVVLALAERGQLAALALEMAEQGRSTAGLARHADEAQVRDALAWRDEWWPWAQYGPVVMAAVRAGVAVLGANLPRADMANAMNNIALDDHLTPTLWQKQQESIRRGHCGLLPEPQVRPMARIQIARDAAMARTVQSVLQPGRTVLLVAGAWHVQRDLGVPSHFSAGVRARIALARTPGTQPDADAAVADAVWPTAPVASVDHCAELKKTLERPRP